jgi:hypothetical protein
MAKVKYVTSANEIASRRAKIPAGHVWSKGTRKRDMTLALPLRCPPTVKTVSKLSFLTAVHTAKGIAKQEGISEIFVCIATTPWRTPTISHPRLAVLRRRGYENAASDRGRGARIAVRRNYATPSALVVWPGSPQPNHVVGMKTQR